MLGFAITNCRCLAAFSLAFCLTSPAAAGTVWIADWTLVAPVDANDFHIALRFANLKTARPQPKKLTGNPFSIVDSKKDEVAKHITNIDWRSSDLLGPFLLKKDENLKIGFTVTDSTGATAKAPVIEKAFWTKDGTNVFDVSIDTLVFAKQPPSPSKVPLPSSAILLLSALSMVAFWGSLFPAFRRFRSAI